MIIVNFVIKYIIMKTFIFFLLVSPFTFSQSIEYNKPMKKGNYSVYYAKNGTTVKIGDTLHINAPANDRYVYIEQGGTSAGTILANKDIVISKIKVYGTKGHKPNVLIGFNGYGMLIVYMDYENAIEAGEVYNPRGMMTRAQALAILKEKKELLDLELISQSDYNKIKTELSKIILSEN